MALTKKRSTLKPNNSSVVLHLKPILAARNINFPVAFLINIGISNNCAIKLMKGTAVQINLKQLTALCTNLNCTPNDLFALREMNLPAQHHLNKVQSLDDKVLNTTSFFAGKTLEEIKELLGSGV